jgi:hypothetical protein
MLELFSFHKCYPFSGSSFSIKFVLPAVSCTRSLSQVLNFILILLFASMRFLFFILWKCTVSPTFRSMFCFHPQSRGIKEKGIFVLCTQAFPWKHRMREGPNIAFSP